MTHIPRKVRREIFEPAVFWNYAVSRKPLLVRLHKDPVGLLRALHEPIERAAARCTANPETRNERFLVWLKTSATVIHITVTSSLSDLAYVELLAEEYAKLKEYIGAEGGGDPVVNGAVPIFLYDCSELIALNPMQFLDVCAERYDELPAEDVSGANPYRSD